MKKAAILILTAVVVFGVGFVISASLFIQLFTYGEF